MHALSVYSLVSILFGNFGIRSPVLLCQSTIILCTMQNAKQNPKYIGPFFSFYRFLPIDHVRNIILVSTRYFRLQLVFIYLLLYFMPSSSIPLPHLSPFPYSESIFTISQAIMFGFICLAWKTCTKLDLSPSREFSFYQAISFIPQNIVHGVEWIFRYLKKLWQNWGQQNVENLQHPWHRNPFSVIIEYLCKSESQLRLYCQTLHLQWKY